MDIGRQRLHTLIDSIDASELNTAYLLLAKFIPEDIASPDELEAMRAGRGDFERGEYARLEDVAWGE
jgi:hypothetical protein